MVECGKNHYEFKDIFIFLYNKEIFIKIITWFNNFHKYFKLKYMFWIINNFKGFNLLNNYKQCLKILIYLIHYLGNYSKKRSRSKSPLYSMVLEIRWLDSNVGK